MDFNIKWETTKSCLIKKSGNVEITADSKEAAINNTKIYITHKKHPELFNSEIKIISCEILNK